MDQAPQAPPGAPFLKKLDHFLRERHCMPLGNDSVAHFVTRSYLSSLPRGFSTTPVLISKPARHLPETSACLGRLTQRSVGCLRARAGGRHPRSPLGRLTGSHRPCLYLLNRWVGVASYYGGGGAHHGGGWDQGLLCLNHPLSSPSLLSTGAQQG